MSWPQIKKIVILKCLLFLFYTTTMNHFSIGIWHVKKSGFYRQPATTSSVIGARKSSNALPKAKLASEKGQSHWRSAASLIHYSFLNPGKTITSEKYVQQKRCSNNCNACSRHWSIERAQFFPTTMPHHMSHNECFKSWTNWATKFYLILHIHLTSCQLTTTSSISTTFLQRKCFDKQQEAENAFKTSVNPEAWIFMLQE